MDHKFQLRVASPCRAPWENMDGDERVRFCKQCNRNVYNLSAMTEVEAREVIADREGRLCIRFYRRRDGTVLTTDCPIGRKRKLLAKTGRLAIAFTGLAIGVTSDAACGPAADHPEILGEAVMGTPPAPTMGKLATTSADTDTDTDIDADAGADAGADAYRR